MVFLCTPVLKTVNGQKSSKCNYRIQKNILEILRRKLHSRNYKLICRQKNRRACVPKEIRESGLFSRPHYPRPSAHSSTLKPDG